MTMQSEILKQKKLHYDFSSYGYGWDSVKDYVAQPPKLKS